MDTTASICRASPANASFTSSSMRINSKTNGMQTPNRSIDNIFASSTSTDNRKNELIGNGDSSVKITLLPKELSRTLSQHLKSQAKPSLSEPLTKVSNNRRRKSCSRKCGQCHLCRIDQCKSNEQRTTSNDSSYVCAGEVKGQVSLSLLSLQRGGSIRKCISTISNRLQFPKFLNESASAGSQISGISSSCS